MKQKNNSRKTVNIDRNKIPVDESESGDTLSQQTKPLKALMKRSLSFDAKPCGEVSGVKDKTADKIHKRKEKNEN